MSVIFTQPLFPHKGQGSARILFASKIQKDPAPSGRWSGQEPQEPKVNGSKAAIAEVSWFCPNIAVFFAERKPKKDWKSWESGKYMKICGKYDLYHPGNPSLSCWGLVEMVSRDLPQENLRFWGHVPQLDIATLHRHPNCPVCSIWGKSLKNNDGTWWHIVFQTGPPPLGVKILYMAQVSKRETKGAGRRVEKITWKQRGIFAASPLAENQWWVL